jgi:hypothetical protein
MEQVEKQNILNSLRYVRKFSQNQQWLISRLLT